jgi:ADP-ribosylglycohydrolase
VTDDTQMAICLADAIADVRRFDAKEVARRYCEWMDVAFDIGRQTRAALTVIKQGRSASESGFIIWEANGRQPAANGSLMRISPAAVYFVDDAASLRQVAIDDSAITHADPRCRIACAALVAAERHALVEPSATPESMRAAALAQLSEAARCLGARTPDECIDRAIKGLTTDLELAACDDPQLESEEAHMYLQAGFVRVAFRLAFWELLHAPSFKCCVLDCTNRGGDADTNAAIAGALFGALVGQREIPVEWRNKVETCRPVKQQKDNIWNRKYHPTRLFRLLERFEHPA